CAPCPVLVWSGGWPPANLRRGRGRARGQKRSTTAPPRLSYSLQDTPSAFRLVVKRKRVEFEPMIDQPITEAPRHVGLQAFDVFRLELDDLAGAQIDEMVVMAVGHRFIEGAPVPDVVALDDAGILEWVHHPVDR